MTIKHKVFLITLLFVFNAIISNAQESSYKSEFGFRSEMILTWHKVRTVIIPMGFSKVQNCPDQSA
jgi:hypothetical protein